MRNKLIHIPDTVGKLAVTKDTDRGIIWFVRIDYSETPHDAEYQGVIYSRKSSSPDYSENVDSILEDNPDAIPLSYYEHGSCIYSVRDFSSSSDLCRFDGVLDACVWIPDKGVLKTLTMRGYTQGSPERSKWLIECAKDACEAYTFWCNGEIYDYAVTSHKIRYNDAGLAFDFFSDYRFDIPMSEELVDGHYGWESAHKRVSDFCETLCV